MAKKKPRLTVRVPRVRRTLLSLKEVVCPCCKCTLGYAWEVLKEADIVHAKCLPLLK